MMATGVASPSAQGREITRTEMPRENANSREAPIKKYHTAAVIMAIVITVGTKTPAILSAVLAIGALLLLASSTRRII